MDSGSSIGDIKRGLVKKIGHNVVSKGLTLDTIIANGFHIWSSICCRHPGKCMIGKSRNTQNIPNL